MKFFLIAFSVIFYSLTSLYGQVKFEHLTKSDGLPNNNITDIVQDHMGFIWFGSYNGLCRYDGYNFRNFIHDAKNPESIPDNQIRCLMVHTNGDLYIGFNYNGFAIYNTVNDSFTYYGTNENLNLEGEIFCIEEGKESEVWIGTMHGLLKFNPENKQFVRYNLPDYRQEVTSNHITSIYCESKDKIWLYSMNRKVYLFNEAKKDFKNYDLFSNPFGTILLNHGGKIMMDSKKELWIGTEFEGVIRYNPVSEEIKKYSTQNLKLNTNIILDVFEDSGGQIWIATDGGGLYLFDRKNDVFVNFKNNPEDQTSINSDAVYCLYETRPGILWVGTYAGGINIYRKYKHKFISYTEQGPPGKRLSHKSVLSIAEDNSGNILLGTDGGGISKFNPVDKTISFQNKSKGYCFDIVKSLFKDSQNCLWSGSYGEGLCVTFPDGKQKHFTASPAEDSLHLNHPSVWCIEEDKKGNIWLGMLNKGIDVYDKEKKIFKHLSPPGLNTRNESIYSLFRDSKGYMWIGSETGGLLKHEIDKDVYFHFSKSNSKDLQSSYVKAIFEDHMKRIWIGLENGGLSLLINESEKKFKTITSEDGLPGNSVLGILEDGNKSMWLTTNNGLAKFNPDDDEIKSFDIQDGLTSNEFNYGALYKDKKGYIYLGTANGFSYFHPDSLWYNTFKPEISLTSVDISNNPSYNYKNADNEKKNFSCVDKITLGPNDYSITFHFSVLDYLIPEKNKYAYKLSGLHDEWIYKNSENRQATYTSLPPGNYQFVFKGCNNDGVWSNPKSVEISVLPPWWLSKWFRFLVTFGGITIVAAFIYLKFKNERQQRTEQEALVKERTKELNESIIQLNKVNFTKDRLFSIIGHDLKGPANGMKALVTLLRSQYEILSQEEQLEYIEHLEKSSIALSDLVNNLIAWAKLNTNNLTSAKKSVDLKITVDKVLEIYQIEALNKNIDLIHENCDSKVIINIDQDMLETVLRNLVNNALKFTKPGGFIKVKINANDFEVNISVKDSGIGMTEKQIQNLFHSEVTTDGTSGETGTSLGLKVCWEFIEANNGHIKVESTPGKGSIFYLIFPKNQ